LEAEPKAPANTKIFMPLIAGLFGVIAFSLNDLIIRAIGTQISLWIILLATNTGLLFLTFSWLLLKKRNSTHSPAGARGAPAPQICSPALGAGDKGGGSRGFMNALMPSKFLGWPLIFGLAKAVNIVCSVMTFRYLSVAEAYLLVFTYPVWVALIDSLIRRRFFKRYLLPLSLTIAGVLFVYYRGTGFSSGCGVFWGLMTSFLCASSIIMARHLREESPFKILFSSSILCLIVAIGGLLWGHAIAASASASSSVSASVVAASASALWLLPLLVLCSVSGSFGALYAAQNLPSIRAALLCFLQIPLAVLLAWALLHEGTTPRVGIGLALIIAGSVIAQLKRIGLEAPKPAAAQKG
jgi:drug/metabolite transporter (DMT)-like permease